MATGNQPTHSSLEELIKLEIQASLYRKTKSPFETGDHFYTAISRKVVGKVHAAIPKGIVGGIEFTVLQRNF